MSQKKYFPINTATACQLKWTWSTLNLRTGTTASCHRIIPGEFSIDQFDQFHNTAKKISDRKLMLAGQWPSGGCEYCQGIEASGGYSDRMLHNSLDYLTPKELATDTAATTVTPRILEVYLNNTCNFACVYCNGLNSSRINYENVKYPELSTNKTFELSFKPILEVDQPAYMNRLLNWLDNNSTELRQLHILGGEPFYQFEFDQILEFLEAHVNPELELVIVTNLGISQSKLEEYILRLKGLVAQGRIRKLNITASIDCWGAEQEFVRWGLNLNTWERNFEFILAQRWINLNINQTISVLTIKTMPELLRKLASWRQVRNVGHYFSGVTPGPNYLKPHILGAEPFVDSFTSILSLMPDTNEHDQRAKKYMEGIWLQIQANDVNIVELENLVTFLNEIDRRRGTNWKELFPWLLKNYI